jgi:hypothetical protein
MILGRLGYLKRGVRVLNIAPEHFMLTHGVELFGEENYHGYDFAPDQFSEFKYKVKKVDLCGDLGEFGNKAFDVIMHNHVLEHIPCSVSAALQRLNAVLEIGGIHIFSMPIAAGHPTSEDLSPTLSKDERTRRFGQEDHMRYFGDMDIDELVDAAGMRPLIDLSGLLTVDDIRNASIPENSLTEFTPHHIFVWKKTSA